MKIHPNNNTPKIGHKLYQHYRNWPNTIVLLTYKSSTELNYIFESYKLDVTIPKKDWNKFLKSGEITGA